MCKKSEKVVCHFFRERTFRCKIVDKHLSLLATRHLETRLATPLSEGKANHFVFLARFVKLSVERAPFLCERLKIRMLPTIGLVVDGKTKDFIKGLYYNEPLGCMLRYTCACMWVSRIHMVSIELAAAKYWVWSDGLAPTVLIMRSTD